MQCHHTHRNGNVVEGCVISTALSMEIPQSCIDLFNESARLVCKQLKIYHFNEVKAMSVFL